MDSILRIIKIPNLRSSILCSKLAKGFGHNYYGEPAWPNDILFIFPIVILGVASILSGLATTEPYGIGESANPFATPIEILPEWYFYASFNLLRVLPSKLIGVLSMLYVPVNLLLVPFIENVNKYQNPFRRPIVMSLFILATSYSSWLTFGSLKLIQEALPFL